MELWDKSDYCRISKLKTTLSQQSSNFSWTPFILSKNYQQKNSFLKLLQEPIETYQPA